MIYVFQESEKGGEGQIGKWDVLKMECLKIDNT